MPMINPHSPVFDIAEKVALVFILRIPCSVDLFGLCSFGLLKTVKDLISIGMNTLSQEDSHLNADHISMPRYGILHLKHFRLK